MHHRGHSASPEPAPLSPPLKAPRAAEHQADDEQDEDRPDDRSDDAAEVEHVGVPDPEKSREDEPSQERADEAEHDCRDPGLPALEMFEGVVRDRYASHSAGDEAEG
jgi:hypothetical protein